GKLASQTTVYEFAKIKDAIAKNDTEATFWDLPVLKYEDVRVAEVPAGNGPLHTQFGPSSGYSAPARACRPLNPASARSLCWSYRRSAMRSPRCSQLRCRAASCRCYPILHETGMSLSLAWRWPGCWPVWGSPCSGEGSPFREPPTR